MGLSKKPEQDKKPISREKLAELLSSAKKPKIKAELPSLTQVPSRYTPAPKIKMPTDIAPARSEGTFVPTKYQPGYTPPEVFERTLDNTVQMMSSNMGIKAPEKGSYFYDVVKGDILKNKGNLATTTLEDGKTVFGLKSSIADSFLSGLNDYNNASSRGMKYASGNEDENIASLENYFKRRFTSSLPKVDNPILYTIGQMTQPLAAGVTGAVTGLSVGGPYGATAGFLAGAGATFALSAPDGVAVKYGTELESAYMRAREQGYSSKEAYRIANNVAKAGAGGELGMQVIYSMFGTPGQSAAKGLSLGLPATKELTKPLLNESAKKGFALASSKFVNKSYQFAKPAIDFAKPGVFLGTEAALATGVTEIEATKQGIPSENAVEKAISTGSDFAVLDMAIKTALGIVKVPGYLKAQAKNLIQTTEGNAVRQFVKDGEASGIYPQGSVNKIATEVEAQSKAKEMSPKYPGDDVREGVVSGLTQKLNNLIEEQGKLAEVHKADMQPRIDDVKRRIEIAKTAENPLEAELHEDGTPLIISNKNKDYATQESTGKVQEGGTEGGIAERKGTISEQQKEATVTTKTDEAGISDSPVVSEGQVEQPPVVSFANKIRKFKIDESVLTGGDKGVAQTNIAGLPIAIYNASIEAIAKGVEAGGKLADLIEEQIKSLREGGYAFKEDKFRKNVSLIDRVSNEKSTLKAEAEMAGIKSSDYSEMQRFALEKYDEPSGIYKDPENLVKAVRNKLNEKMDTSNISDDVIERLVYESVVNKEQAPFVPGPAKKIPTGAEPESIVTNTKEVFKSMYTAATNVGKSVEERVLGAANMISEYIKKKDKLNIPPKDIAKSIGKYVTSKMDSETATEVFAQNLSDIIESARDANQIAANKTLINKIKKDAKSPSFGTVATRETTAGIDFISPIKIKETVNPDNPAEVIVTAADKRKEYQELLTDYRNSITGNPTKSRTARLDLIDFINRERNNYNEFVDRQAANRRTSAGAKYDKLVAEGKIDKDVVSREAFIEGDVNPNAAISDEVDEAIAVAEVDKVEAYKEVVNGKRNDLRQEVNEGNIDPIDLEDVQFLLNAPLDKVSPRNLKLLSNIIEDVLNGERPSRIGDIISDVQTVESISKLKQSIDRVRDIAKVKFSGAARKLRQVFDKSYKGSEEAYDEIGVTNTIRAYTLNSKAEEIFRSVVIGGFERMAKVVNTQSKAYTENLSKIFTGNSVVLDGQKISLKGEAPLTEKNSQKIGIVAALLNFDNPLNTINAIIESTKMLDALKDRKYIPMVKERIKALYDLGVIDSQPTKSVDIQAILPKSEFDPQSAISALNKRESLALQYIISENKKIAPQLDRVTRQYFGSSVDMSNPNYVGMPTFFTDVLEDIEGAIEQPLYDFAQVNKMRASATMKRSNEMIFPTGEKNRTVHYDFDIFRTQPKRFHESLTTIMTTGETRKMAKMFARKEFQNFIKGKYNIEQNIFGDNMRVFKKIMTEYVNGERKPYVVTREIEKQRSAISRFFYGKLLNSLEAGALQYVPNLPSLIIESPQSFAKALELTSSSLFDEDVSSALVKFLSQTSKSSRVTGGFEALTKSARSIADNAATRNISNLYKLVDDGLGASLEYGDRLTTVQSLLTGYIKSLISSGKIKNAAEFNIVDEVNRGLDQEALSAAETFMSFINNESTTYAKAKVFRKDGANWLRMLQSFSHNATTNFLVDLGRFTDEMSNTSDKTEALKRMTQYIMSIGMYGLGTYYAGSFKAKMARDAMKHIGIIEDSEDMKKAVEEDKEKTKTLIINGVLFDAMLSRQIAPVSELVKAGADMFYQYGKKMLTEESDKMGEDVSGSILGKEYSPFYEGKYMGTVGSYVTDFEKLVQGMMKDDTEVEYKNLLTEEQREAQRIIRWISVAGFGIPSKDVKRLVSAANKALRQGKMTQLEKDAQNYILATSEPVIGGVTQADIDKGKAYLESRRNAFKTPMDFDAYTATKVKDFAENVIKKNELVAGAKRFGEQFSKDVLTIKSASANKKILILNNRFPNDKIREGQDGVIDFMIRNNVISPMEYATTVMYDKNGKLKSESEMKALMTEASMRYLDAKWVLKGKKYIRSITDGGTKLLRLSGENDMEEANDVANKIMAEYYMKKKVQE